MNNVTVTYLEGRDDWAGGEWVAQPEGDEYELVVPCSCADLAVSRDTGASVRESSKVLSACFGEEWRTTKDEAGDPVVISAWTCAVRDKGTIDSVLRTSRRVARMVRKYIPEFRCVHAKNLERDVQLVDWSECDGQFVNTIRMSVVAAEPSVQCVEDMCASHRSVTLRLSLWCVVGRNDSCEVFWNLHSVEADEAAAEDAAEPAQAEEEPPAAADEEEPASEDDLRRLRRALNRARARYPNAEDSDSDAEPSAAADAARALVAEVEEALAAAAVPAREFAERATAQLKAVIKR